MHWLKQSTAVTLKVGPFVDSTDGVTAETGLTITQADVRLSKNGGDFAQKAEATSATHDELGYYDVPLDTTDTGTLGRLRVVVSESGALPVVADFVVVTANVYDTLFSTDKLDVNVAEWLGTAPATPTTAGVPEVDITHVKGNVVTTHQGTAQSVTGSTIVLQDSLSSSEDDTYNGAEITILTATTGSEQTVTVTDYEGSTKTATVAWHAGTPTGTVTYELVPRAPGGSAAAIADAVLDEALSGHTTAGSLGKAIADIEADATAILVDTGTTLDGKLDTIDGVVDAILADTGTDGVVVNAAGLANDAVTEIAAAVLTTAMTEAYGSDGGTVTLAQGIYELLAMLEEMTISGTTMTVKKRDGTTTAFTLTLNSSTSPTSITRAS